MRMFIPDSHDWETFRRGLYQIVWQHELKLSFWKREVFGLRESAAGRRTAEEFMFMGAGPGGAGECGECYEWAFDEMPKLESQGLITQVPGPFKLRTFKPLFGACKVLTRVEAR